jgi:hypothetical protein
MSQRIIISCDICCEVIPKGYWDTDPSSMSFALSAPGSNDGKLHAEHVCYTCRKGIRAALDAYIEQPTKN